MKHNSFLVTVVDLHGLGDQFKPTINCIKFFEEVINFIASVFAHSDLQYDTGYGEQMVRVGVRCSINRSYLTTHVLLSHL